MISMDFLKATLQLWKNKGNNMDITHIDKPNLFEDIFGHDSVPRITFDGKMYEEINGKLVHFDPADMLARDIHITDTTFRDGQQARPPYSVEQTVKLYDLMSGLGGPNGIIRQSEFFLYNDKDRKAVEKCRELGHRFPEITGWIRAKKGDLKLVKQAGLSETGMLTSCSDYHIFYKMNKNREEALNDYLEVVEEALAAGVRNDWQQVWWQAWDQVGNQVRSQVYFQAKEQINETD